MLRRMRQAAAAILLMSLPISCMENTMPSSPTNTSSAESSSNSAAQTETRKVRIFSLPEETPRYDKARLFVGDREVPLMAVKVNDSHVFGFPSSTRIDAGVARVAIRGRISFTLKTTYGIGYDTVVYPSSYAIVPTVNNSRQETSFEIYNAGSYVIEPNGDPTLAIHLFVYDIDADPLEDVDQSSYRIVEFGKGLHTKDNSELIGQDGKIDIASHTIVKIDGDAVVQGRFSIDSASDIYIVGAGIIDGSAFARTDVLVPIDFSRSSDIHLRGINIYDPAAWSCNLYFCVDSEINGINIISSRANGDGITLQSCKRVTVANSFVRGYDDNLVVKNYSFPYGNPDRTTHGSSTAISFFNCTLWTDLAQSMEIGYETVGPTISDVSFENINVIHAFHKPVMSIHNGNYAEIYDIRYRDITIDKAFLGSGDAGSDSYVIELGSAYSPVWSNAPAGGQTEVGSIHDIAFANILLRQRGNATSPTINLFGYLDTREAYQGRISELSRVSFNGVDFLGTALSADYPGLTVGPYVADLSFAESEATGAKVIRTWTKEYLDSLSEQIDFVP